MSDQQPPVPPVPPAPPAEGVTPPAAPEPPIQPTYPAYGQPAPAYAPPTNTLAIVALVLGFVFPIGGIICGHIARNQIKRTGEGGDGLALAGLILGYAFTALTLLIVIGYLIFIIAMFSTFGAASTYY